MARRKKAVTGLINELAAQLDLAKDPNILVFIPLGGLGPVDIVTLNMSTGEITWLKMAIREMLKDLLSTAKQLWNKRN